MQTQSQEEMVLDPSLKLYLPLYKRDGVQFISDDAYGHLCTVTGALWTPQGRRFDGDDYIAFSSSVLNLTSSDYSILAWIKITDLTLDNTIFCRGLNSADGYFFYIAANSNLVAQTCQLNANQLSYSSGSQITVNNWFLVGLACTGSSIRVYKNAIDVTSTAATHINPLTSARTARVGVYDDLTSSPFKGIYGEALIYNRALASQEIQRIYLQTKWRYR